MVDPLHVLFLAAEAEPFIKIGGLADVAGSLPMALRALPAEISNGVGLDVRLVLPLHRSIRAEANTLRLVAEFSIYRRGENQAVQVFEMSLGGMPVYFISGDRINNTPSVYSPDMAADRDKYAFFSLAALELTRRLNWKPAILHANDWHTSLALYALRSRNSHQDGTASGMHTVLTVHNLPFMGSDGSDALDAYGLLPLEEADLPPWALTQPLPLGLWSADAIVPVSPTYGEEILTPEFGCGLEGYLRTRRNDICGILNGIDAETWNPWTDNCLTSHFDAEHLRARGANKSALQRAMGLEENDRVPLLAMIGRIDQQKGIDIAFESLRQIEAIDWQFVMLGSGDPVLEGAAHSLQAAFPERVGLALRYDARLSRQIYGGADILMMPSRYEPCGLAQMIAMRYGCVPVVRATGGLVDTVMEGRTGFLFRDTDPKSMSEALHRALAVHANPQEWGKIQHNAMNEDFTWPRSARQYAMIYQSLVSRSERGES